MTKRRRSTHPTRRCTTKDCNRHSTPRSFWCLLCRASLYRWIGMSVAERRASYGRAELRWGRVNAFGGTSKVVRFQPRAARAS